MNESLVQLLHDHYKDTFSHIRERELSRDRLFLVVLALLGVLLLQLNYSFFLTQAVSEVTLAGSKLSIQKIPVPILLSANWTFLAVCLIRYYQATIHVEKQYDYLHPLEKRLTEAIENENTIFFRESAGYTTKKASWFRHWVWIFYTIFFPAMTFVSIVWALLIEWYAPIISMGHKCFDSVLALVILISLALYLVGTWIER